MQLIPNQCILNCKTSLLLNPSIPNWARNVRPVSPFGYQCSYPPGSAPNLSILILLLCWAPEAMHIPEQLGRDAHGPGFHSPLDPRFPAYHAKLGGRGLVRCPAHVTEIGAPILAGACNRHQQQQSFVSDSETRKSQLMLQTCHQISGDQKELGLTQSDMGRGWCLLNSGC